LNRRSFLKGVGGVAGAAVLRPAWPAASAPAALLQPAEIRSANGILTAAIRAAPGSVRLGDSTFPGLLYNGAYIPPLLRVRLGDTMRIRFSNALPDDASNLHFHGMSVSPQGRSDNVFVHVHPGGAFDYEVQVQANGRQGPGLFWYHPHLHGVVDKQILGGMSGALVVDGAEELYPIVKGLPERFFLIKHFELAEKQVISINGQLDPLVELRAGEMQLWRIANIGAEQFLRLRIDGMPLYVIATDGHPLSRPRKVPELFLGPGQRVDALAIAPPAGEYALATVPFQNEAWRKPEAPVRLATIVSRGGGASGGNLEAGVLGARLAVANWADEVRSTPIAKRRTLTYSRTPDRKVFMIDGHVMQDDRVDHRARLGDTEEWTVVNTDQQFHSFHIHQTPFLVTEVNGVRQNEDSLRDTFSVPPATAQGDGVLKVVIPFTDPVIVGRFVYHCHAVDHEDKGMMGVIEVVA
jgi:FtsP/CotA-like multicopper oxidase with cupredoxin domain